MTGPETPALLTILSTVTLSFFKSSNILFIAFSSLTSTPEKILTLAPLCFSAIIDSNILAVSSNGSLRRPSMMTLAPFSTNFLAMA